VQQLRDFLSEAKRNFYNKQLQVARHESAYLNQLNELMADQGLMPSQYFSREGISLRLHHTYRQN
jgi:hypothetical protein